MITDAMAKPISRFATKSFTSLNKDPSKPTIKKIFFDQWDDFLLDPQIKRNGLRDVTRLEVEKMLTCGTIDAGFEIYECPDCHKSHIICYTCKSRFCPTCGVKYAKQRAANVSKSCLDVKHRHMVFTIDKRLRDYFLL
ncbi:transposase zinc-binding domain-containing protein, partial [Anaerorhabdus sp.]|uniref:transposase zinc-binding domain-containing protein n=1 Tax=Anaerorhabdus sp. TaxID=1872524 RepID=UPI002FC7436B